jgi:hypothetical protein
MTEVYLPKNRDRDEQSALSIAPESPQGTSSGSDNELEPMSDADSTAETETKPTPLDNLPPDPGVSAGIPAEMPKKGKGSKGSKKPTQSKGGVKKGKSAETKIRETKKKLFNIISTL